MFVNGLYTNITYQIMFWSLLWVNCNSRKLVFYWWLLPFLSSKPMSLPFSRNRVSVQTIRLINLNYISKVLECLFLPRFQSHVTNCPNFNSFQSAYRRHHSTDTALICTLDNIYHNSACGCATALISLDLSAGFDTIDHSILTNRLQSSFGVSGLALSWISSI